jgi:hypothetical protein
MRLLAALLVGLVVCAPLAAQGTRYNVEVNLGRYPQKTPQQTLQSVLKAYDDGRMYYLVAQLADPRFVDEKVKEHKQKLGDAGTPEARDLVAFEEVVKDIGGHFRADPSLIRELQRFSAEGTWQVSGERATARLKDSGRRVNMRKVGERWFLENRQQ